MAKTVTFDSQSIARYEFAHGHKPRGTGNWCFLLGRDGAYTTFEVSCPLTLTDARKQAMAEARSLGCTSVSLES